jgi:DNA-binding transcriptional LysR family regulator
LNLHRFEIFLAVADTGNFSRAAEKMLLTQSTISQHIAALESELGIRLFDRTGRGAELTDGGRLFSQHVRQILRDCGELRQAMARFQGMEDTQLTVGASNIPANYLIPEILSTLINRHPGIKLNVIAGDSRQVIDQLLSGGVALAVVGNRFGDEAVTYSPLVSDTLLFVVGAGQPWQVSNVLELSELASTPLIVREAGSGTGRSTERALQAAGLDPAQLHIVARLGSNEAVKQAVIRGAGAAFLSSLSIQRELRCGELIALDVEGVTIVRRFWLATRRGRTLSPAAHSFATLLTEALGIDVPDEETTLTLINRGLDNRRQ